MTITKKLILALLGEIDNGAVPRSFIENAADQLAEQLDRLEKIKDRAYTLRMEKGLRTKQYHEEMAVIDKEIRDVQKDCPHWTRTHHVDPAGGSDSHQTCDVCGRQS